jgi:putative serine protease PepD
MAGPMPYGGYGAAGPVPPSARDQRRNGRTRSVLPLVAAVALVVGLVGGALGGVAVEKWNDANQEPGRTSNGLADVDTVAKAPLPADNGSIASVAQKLLPSTVQIVADFEGQDGGATGSGFYLDKQGHVVTNNHVVQDAAEKNGNIQVIDHEGKRYKATVVGRSKVYDLAVLYIKDAPKVTPASLGTSTNLQIGEGVVAFGSPLGLSSTVTSGIVSALDRPVTTGSDGKDLSSYINAVQTDAAINPGNSGGPLVDMRGQVVGVNSAIATTGGSLGGESGNIGVGFAIPIEQVKVTADQILRTGEARYPVIGAKVQTGQRDGNGAEIDSVVDGTPADDAGLQKGDVIIALEGHRVTDGIALIVSIRSHQPGETLTFTVVRDGDEKDIKVTLDSEVG